MKRMLLIAASALLLSACASSGMHNGMVYRDGSWYAPAGDGHGDYYTGSTRSDDYYYDWPWAWSVGYVPYGGYCPVRYRYCTSFWADPFYGPGYYPYGYRSGGYQPWLYQHRHRGHDSDFRTSNRGTRPRMTRDPEPRITPRNNTGGPAWGQERTERGGGRMRREAKGEDSGTN